MNVSPDEEFDEGPFHPIWGVIFVGIVAGYVYALFFHEAPVPPAGVPEKCVVVDEMAIERIPDYLEGRHEVSCPEGWIPGKKHTVF